MAYNDFSSPQRLSIPASAWRTIDVSRPSLLIPLSSPQSALLAHPRHAGPDTTMVYRATGNSLYLPFAGSWAVRNDGASIVELLQIEAPDESSRNAYHVPGYAQATAANVTVTSAAAVTVAAFNANRRSLAVVNLPGFPVSLRWDGTDPTSTVGWRLEVGASLIADGDELFLQRLRGIGIGGDATVHVVEGT